MFCLKIKKKKYRIDKFKQNNYRYVYSTFFFIEIEHVLF